jgi:hypothetical protein
MKKPPDKYKCIKLPIISILNKNEESHNILILFKMLFIELIILLLKQVYY